MIKLSDSGIELDIYYHKLTNDYMLVDDDLQKYRLYTIITRYSGKRATPRLVYADYVRVIKHINDVSCTISLIRVKDENLPKLCKEEMPNVIDDAKIISYNKFYSDPKAAWGYFLNSSRHRIRDYQERVDYNERLFRLGKREAAKVGFKY